MSIAVHPKTKAGMDRYLNQPSQVLAIIGEARSGKAQVARQIAAQLLDVPEEKLQAHRHFIVLQRLPNQRDISIDSVRSLIKELRTKALGDGSIKRVVLVEEAGKLSQEAQNALLKTLEQPNPDTVFILTLDSVHSVLVTVLSRSTKLIVYPLSLQAAIDSYPAHTKPEVELAWNMSEGAAGLIDDLLNSDEDIAEKQAVEKAKQFLASDTYHRLLSTNELTQDKEALAAFLDGLAKLLKALHHSSVKSSSRGNSRRLLGARKLVATSQAALQANASAKLVMLNLVTNLGV
ncbi:MAG TPA: hypothetical protein VMT23_01875 [Candidatus Binatia bacterium]|nr:hypothetical protein [Candidatus Binatia bacterium]